MFVTINRSKEINEMKRLVASQKMTGQNFYLVESPR
jgi:hypothetical protein